MPALGNTIHEKFAQAYVALGHVGKAAEEAGIQSLRYGRMALADPKVKARVQELIGERFSKANITAERTMQELARIAYADIRDLYDENGELLPIPELDDDAAAIISAVNVEVVGQGRGANRQVVVTKKVKVADKMAALSILARHFKLVGDVDDGVNVLANALADRLKRGRARAAVDMGDVQEVHRAEADIEASGAAPGTRLEYTVPGDPSNANDLAENWKVVMPDPETLHSPYHTAERVSPAPASAAPGTPGAPTSAGDDDEPLW